MDKKAYYVGKWVSAVTDDAKELAVFNEVLSDEALDKRQQAKIVKLLNKMKEKVEAEHKQWVRRMMN